MNIIYLSFYALPGRGTHTIQIMNMCSAFSKIPGISITLITPKQSDSRLDDVKTNLWSFYGIEETFKINFTPDRFNLRNKNQLLVKFYRIIITFFYALNFLRKTKDDFIIYSRAPRIVNLLSSFLSLLRVKAYKGFFLELHDLPKNLFPLKKAGGLITISETLKKDLLIKYPAIKPEKILVAHDGVNLNHKPITESISEIREKLGLPLDKKIITYTGRIINGKGVDILIKAFAEINDRDNSYLLLVGKVYDSFFPQLAENLNIKNIKFTGFVQPSVVREYHYGSDILVLPSTHELPYAKYTSPLKLFEYMAAKRPIIASSLNGIKEVVHNGYNGIIFSLSEVNSLTKFLDEALLNYPKYSKLAEIAFKNVSTYSWQNRAELISKFINLICNDSISNSVF